jgi:SsrA-binding protein
VRRRPEGNTLNVSAAPAKCPFPRRLIDGDQITLVNAHIPEYSGANRFNHEPRRPRRLLLHRRQIDKLLGAVRRDGRTIIPTRLYWNDKGRAKLELALAKRKTTPDKRHTEAERDWKREQGRLMRDRG